MGWQICATSHERKQTKAETKTVTSNDPTVEWNALTGTHLRAHDNHAALPSIVQLDCVMTAERWHTRSCIKFIKLCSYSAACLKEAILGTIRNTISKEQLKPLAATASTQRCGEAVIGHRADSCPPCQVKSPCNSWPLAVRCLFLRCNHG